MKHHEIIKNTIQKNKLPKKDVAKEAGINYTSLINFLHGRRSLHLQKVERLMKILNITLKNEL